jgi:hypothetical protein
MNGNPTLAPWVCHVHHRRKIVSERGTPLRIAPDEYRLDSQTLMRTRAITPESAEILDAVLAESAGGEAIASSALADRLNAK